jgi:hypothetical protein
MILTEADKSGLVLTMSFSQHVGVDEMKTCVERVKDLLGDMKPGFCLLTDLSSLESMDEACAPFVGAIMDLCKAKEMKTVARVIPDHLKDIGFALISRFHDAADVQSSTHMNLAEAIKWLSTEWFGKPLMIQPASRGNIPSKSLQLSIPPARPILSAKKAPTIYARWEAVMHFVLWKL